jgi:anti-sigma B factor antagonist
VRIVRVDDGDVVRLRVDGELDLATTDLLTEQVETVLAPPVPGRLEIDLGGLTFCDSTGLDVLLGARESALAAGAGFAVIRAQGIVRRAMLATGVHELLTGGRDGSDPRQSDRGGGAPAHAG